MILWIYKISKDFMNFKDALKRNDYQTLSIITFSIQTIFFMRDRERERGEERRERREKR